MKTPPSDRSLSAALRKTRNRRRLVRRFAFGILTLFILAEAALPLVLTNMRGLFVLEPHLSFRPRPLAVCWDYSTLLFERRTVEYRLGRYGQRIGGEDEDFDPSDPAIFCFGDSHTFGQGLEYAETYPAQTEQLLGGSARILNFGVPAYNAAQSVILAKEIVRIAPPRLIVFQLCANDDEPVIPLSTVLRTRVLRESRLFSLAYFAYMLRYPPRSTVATADAAQSAGAMLEIARDHGAPMIFLIEGYPPSLTAKVLDRLCESAAAKCASLDFTNLLSTHSLRSSPHMNAAGNAVIAAALAREIEQRVPHL